MSEYEKSKFDEGYDRGYEAGLKQQPDKDAIRARYEYLLKGGRWQCRDGADRDAEAYLDGYIDAMCAAGVKP